MKIILLSLLLALAAFIGAVYIFIPETITVSKVVTVKIPTGRVPDFFLDMELARKWMPGQHNPPGKCFDDGGARFCIIDNGTGSVVVETRANGLRDQYAYLYFDPLRADSTAVTWKISYSAGNSPFSRFKIYMAARRLKKHITTALERLVALSQNKKDLYGFAPVQEKVQDTLSISQKKIFDHYPLPQETGELLQQLRDYVTKQGATVTRPPMMHVLQTDKQQYEVMVALPIDHVIPDAGNFIVKRMPHGKIISATVTGGMYTIRKGLQQLEQYKMDNILTSPAIPYQSMVTDRVSEPDTTKWVTVLYYPVF